MQAWLHSIALLSNYSWRLLVSWWHYIACQAYATLILTPDFHGDTIAALHASLSDQAVFHGDTLSLASLHPTASMLLLLNTEAVQRRKVAQMHKC